MVELMVPRSSITKARITGFYEGIDWETYADTDEHNFLYVRPVKGSVIGPTIAYWLTTNAEKIAHFERYDDYKPSRYAFGWRLPILQDLVEISLVLPSDQDVQDLYERGGDLLATHTHIGPREHAGAREFRFADPFNYSLRVTADPGYQLHGPQ